MQQQQQQQGHDVACAQCERLQERLTAVEHNLALSAEAGMQLLSTNRLLQQGQSADVQKLLDRNEELLQVQHTLKLRLADTEDLVRTLEQQQQAREEDAALAERTARKTKTMLEGRLQEVQAELQHQRAHAADAAARLEAVAGSESRLQRRVVQLEGELASLKADAAEAGTLRAEVARLTGTLHHQTQQSQEMENLFTAHLHDLQAARDALSDTRKEAARQTRRCADLERSLLEVREQVHAYEVRLAQQQAAPSGPGECMAAVMAPLSADHPDELRRLRSDLAAAMERANALATFNSTLEAQLDRARHEGTRHFEQLMQAEASVFFLLLLL